MALYLLSYVSNKKKYTAHRDAMYSFYNAFTWMLTRVGSFERPIVSTVAAAQTYGRRLAF